MSISPMSIPVILFALCNMFSNQVVLTLRPIIHNIIPVRCNKHQVYLCFNTAGVKHSHGLLDWYKRLALKEISSGNLLIPLDAEIWNCTPGLKTSTGFRGEDALRCNASWSYLLSFSLTCSLIFSLADANIWVENPLSIFYQTSGL